MIRTSETHPIRVNTVPVLNGLLGLTFCPGKRGASVHGAPWARDLDTDLVQLRAWGAKLLITLIEPHEFDLLCVPDLGKRVVELGMNWAHLPIRDVDVPAQGFEARWSTQCTEILNRLGQGEYVVLHCRGGLGRAGLVAALVLIESGLPAEAAIRTVREARPGAIETSAQEQYVRAYGSSAPPAQP